MDFDQWLCDFENYVRSGFYVEVLPKHNRIVVFRDSYGSDDCHIYPYSRRSYMRLRALLGSPRFSGFGGPHAFWTSESVGETYVQFLFSRLDQLFLGLPFFIQAFAVRNLRTALEKSAKKGGQ